MKKTFLIILAVALIFTTVSCTLESLQGLAGFAGMGKKGLFVKPSMELVSETADTVDKLADKIQSLDDLDELIVVKHDPDNKMIRFEFDPELVDLAHDIKIQAGTITNPEQLDQLRKQMKEPVPEAVAEKISAKFNELESSLNESMEELLSQADEAILDFLSNSNLPEETKEIMNDLKAKFDDAVSTIIHDVIPDLENKQTTTGQLVSGVLLFEFADSVQDVVMDIVTPLAEGGEGLSPDEMLGSATDFYNEFYGTSKALENINEPDSPLGKSAKNSMEVVDGLIQNLPVFFMK